jgi:ferric-dicitrate binding protein FerR (iron transport regulator)
MKEDYKKYSDEEAYRVARLIAAFIRGTITRKEHEELDAWVEASDENMKLFGKLIDEVNIDAATSWMQELETEKALAEKKQQLQFERPAGKRVWLRFLPYAVAASILLLLGWIFWNKGPDSNNKEQASISPSNDIAPGSNKALLVLSDGTKVELDSFANGRILRQGNTGINKKDGLLEYANGSASGELLYNTVSTPRGGQYKLTLSDGTRVWLNAASSIYFPVTFAGSDRIVSVSGEVYFEVAKNPGKPFKIKVNDILVEVLGTHFNINAYEDEPVIKTTLAEGALRIIKNDKEILLKPGQEARVSRSNGIETVSAQLDETLAWKEGNFLFRDQQIEAIMRQVSRWYDAEIIYQDRPADHFNVEIARNVPVSKLLHFLELTDRVQFTIEGKTITVSTTRKTK